MSGHFADAGGAWFVRFSGDGNQIGRGLAQQGEQLAVLVHSSGPLLVGARPVSAPSWPATVLAQFAVDGTLMWMRALAEPSAHLAVARNGRSWSPSATRAHACAHTMSWAASTG